MLATDRIPPVVPGPGLIIFTCSHCKATDSVLVDAADWRSADAAHRRTVPPTADDDENG